MSSYTPCACRDCFDITVSGDTPQMCAECEEAGCLPITGWREPIQFASAYECQRTDAYEDASQE